MTRRLSLVPTDPISSPLPLHPSAIVPIFGIRVPEDRARSLDPLMVEALAGSIAEQGLLQPIVIWDNGTELILVAGLRRLLAVQSLGWTEIPVTYSQAANETEARLDEVMENLARGELNALDRCQHLFELKQAWERSRVRTLVEVLTDEGGKTFSTPAEVFGFARSVAEKIGLTKQAINMAVKIWSDLGPASRACLAGTHLSEKQTELKALSEQQPEVQVKILDLILGAEHPLIENVAAALAFLQHGINDSSIEKQFRSVDKAFSRLSDAAVDMVTANHADRIIASLKRLGRI